jgi:O-antigen ligase
LLLAASLLPADTYFCWAGLGLLLLPLFTLPERQLPVNALSVSLVLFCALLLGNAVFYTPHYSAYSIYRPVALFGGFAAAALLRPKELEDLLSAGTALLSLLVLFGLLQVLLGFWPYELDAARAAASFATPNTFATAINLFLLPVIALASTGRGGRAAYLASLWLFAGLLSTESRGGWIAFLAGLAFIVAYSGLPKAREAWLRWKQLLAGLLWVWIAYYALKALLAALSQSLGRGSIGAMLVEDIAARGTSFRLDLASVAIGQIAERPFAGAGANTFWPLYEMVKPPELDIGITFPFVHNDYLQIWLEYGLGGIVLLGAMMAAAAAMILAARRERREKPELLVIGAALTSIFVHALVDFPLYVPFPVMVLGGWLGVLAAHAGDAPWAAKPAARVREWLVPLRTPLVTGAAAVLAIAWLAQPAIAYVAANRALTELFAGRADEGLYWQSVARRMEPRSGRRYWEEGVILREQALAADDRSLAARADAVFAEGTRVDPYDVNNFVELARLHMMRPTLLDQPAPPETVLAWTLEVLRLRPYSIATQAEYARALAYAGRAEEARRLARDMLARHPDSQIARRLAAEL